VPCLAVHKRAWVTLSFGGRCCDASMYRLLGRTEGVQVVATFLRRLFFFDLHFHHEQSARVARV
jgi:hypothetical protein